MWNKSNVFCRSNKDRCGTEREMNCWASQSGTRRSGFVRNWISCSSPRHRTMGLIFLDCRADSFCITWTKKKTQRKDLYNFRCEKPVFLVPNYPDDQNRALSIWSTYLHADVLRMLWIVWKFFVIIIFFLNLHWKFIFE